MNFGRVAAVIATAILALGAVAPSHAQAGMRVGYIDIDDVYNRSDTKKANDDKLQDLSKSLNTRLGSLDDAALLPSATWQQLKTLLEKPKPTADDTSQINAIQNQIKSLDTELKTLQQTTSPTDAQRNRLNELTGNGTANQGNLQNAKNDYEREFAKMQMDLQDQAIAAIKKAADQVAKAQHLDVILNKAALIAGGTDVTEDVVKQINKK